MINNLERLKLHKDALMQQTSLLATHQKATNALHLFESDLANSEREIHMTEENEKAVRAELTASIELTKAGLKQVNEFVGLVGGDL